MLDHNLSPTLVQPLSDLYPGSIHVRKVGLQSADDETIWRYAAEQGYTIVSKDTDFHQRSFLYGPPPKVIWIRLGNCSTAQIAKLLRAHFSDLLAFEQDDHATFLALG